MSIFPATDLVTDVARAADPQKLHVAMKRLSNLSEGAAGNGEEFAVALKSENGRSPAAGASPGLQSARISSGMYPANGATVRSDARASSSSASDAVRKFEAYVIQVSLEAILPKEEHGSYGGGMAGGIWRSMMAEQLGAQIAKAGGVGIQKMFDRHWLGQAAQAHSPASVS